MALHRRWHLQIGKVHMRSNSSTITWVLLIIAIAISVAGVIWNLYQQWWWFDEFTHAFFFFALSLFLGIRLYSKVLVGAAEHRLLLTLVVASIGIALGAWWEVGEWIYDQFASGNVVKGKQDTIIDLVVDSVGALIAGGFVAGQGAGERRAT